LIGCLHRGRGSSQNQPPAGAGSCADRYYFRLVQVRSSRARLCETQRQRTARTTAALSPPSSIEAGRSDERTLDRRPA
jgi:hypothetical protein